MVKPISLGIDKKAKDPVRYPQIINPLENEAKLIFIKGLSEIKSEISKEMKNIINK